jgi:alkyldihydroxyacetonephosphate synthase
MAPARLKVFGWGREDEGMTAEEEAFALDVHSRRFGTADFPSIATPTLADIHLRPPRIAPPSALKRICSTETYDRAAHAHGKGFTDAVRALLNDFDSAPDVVAYPTNEQDIAAVMDWAGSVGAALIPFGGGSSVVGGVTPPTDAPAAITVDLKQLDKVLEIDRSSRAARIQAGVFGPALENQLRPHRLTLRHFPQSFEFSTLGGWIATRSGGHFATLYTQIDDFVESLRVVTPAGTLQSRRLPGSGAGPSPDRMFIGSEGILGVITEAWMRLQDRPRFRAGGAVRFMDFFTAARALRLLSQAGLYPANCRILDAEEAFNTGAGDGSVAIMVLAFESADHPLDAWMARALECCADHGGVPEGAGRTDAHREGAAGQWRNAFIRMPYGRERMTPRGIISDTFETAITWDRFETFHDQVKAAAEQAIRDATGRPGQVTCRFTHVYPDGPAPYFSFHALGRHGALIEQWQTIKTAASDAVIAGGGTITHHHAVGRDHRPWYDRQRPDLFAAALTAAKRALDPRGILNPGVLIDP